ncbi:MAG: DUF2550 domain-containing protein [Propionibacteriaceae bacterium]|nr:DUF2550 domain-containing protein [Propionibacteriaceae bacterium]
MQYIVPLTEIIAVIVAICIIVPVGWLFLKRRWLARKGGLFDCCLRLPDSGSGKGWVLGVARYNGQYLEWFRIFAITFRPRKVFDRAAVEAKTQRDPEADESGLLMSGQRIIMLRRVDGREWELAMSQESITGLLSWLHAAPPVEAPGL